MPSLNVTALGLRPTAIAALLALPGDFALNAAFYKGTPNTLSGNLLYHLTDTFGIGGALVDLINATNPYQEYSHSAFIPDIDPVRGIAQLSWFMGTTIGTVFEDTRPEYFRNFTVCRVKGVRLERNEWALIKAKNMSFRDKFGVCADAVNSVYDDTISRHSPARQAVLRQAMGPLQPIANVDTPSALARSPQVIRICKVEDEVIVEPRSIRTADLVLTLALASQSPAEELRGHALRARETLRRLGIITGDAIAVDELVFVP